MKVLVVALAKADASAVELLSRHGHEVSELPRLDTLNEAAAGLHPEVVLLVSGRSGARLLEAVETAARDDLPIVVMCDRIGGNDARFLIAAGARGLVISRDARRTLLPTMHAVSAGQVCVPYRHARFAERPGLSTREKQVMGLVALGFSNNEIADRLYLAESTVKSHLSSAFGKLGVRSRHEAVELIVNPASGLSSGIMSLGAEPLGAEPIDALSDLPPD